MSWEIFDCLKRERGIWVKTILPSQTTVFRCIPGREGRKCFGNSSCSYCQANGWVGITILTRLSRLEIKNAISWHCRTKIRLAPKRRYASCESSKCLSQGRESAFHFLFKVSRIKYVSEAPRADGLVRVGLYKDSAPVNSTPYGEQGGAENEEHFAQMISLFCFSLGKHVKTHILTCIHFRRIYLGLKSWFKRQEIFEIVRL